MTSRHERGFSRTGNAIQVFVPDPSNEDATGGTGVSVMFEHIGDAIAACHGGIGNPGSRRNTRSRSGRRPIDGAPWLKYAKGVMGSYSANSLIRMPSWCREPIRGPIRRWIPTRRPRPTSEDPTARCNATTPGVTEYSVEFDEGIGPSSTTRNAVWHDEQHSEHSKVGPRKPFLLHVAPRRSDRAPATLRARRGTRR